MAEMDEDLFLYDSVLAPLGESKFEVGEEEDFAFNASLRPLESAGSPRGDDSVAEQATSTVTVERQEAKFSRTGTSSGKGRSVQSLIAAEKDLLAVASSPEFRARADTSGSGDLGVVSSRSAFSVSRSNVQSTGDVGVEENVEEAEFMSLEMGDGDVETVVEEVLQANGKLVEGLVEGSMTPKEAPPWARGRESWIQSPLLQLHQEIVDFCEFVAPTEEEQEVRAVAVQRVSGVVKSIWPSCEVKVFGSFATGLYLPTSDVDVVVLESGCQAIQDGLKALAKALTRGHVARSIQVIGKARVPIIKFVETSSNIPFDIRVTQLLLSYVVGNPSDEFACPFVGNMRDFDVANGPEAADFIKSAMGAIPPLRPLCLVLKIFLQQRELNEVYQGGVGSYALLVMILTHLQMHSSKRRAGSRGEVPALETNLGILLVDFLDLYGRTLNMKDVGVSCRGGGRFFPKRDRRFNDSKRPFLLCVEDPQSPDNDIGKNSYAIQKVRSAFMMAHRLLTNLDGDNEAGLLSRIVRMDAKLVGRKAPLSMTPTPPRLAGKRARPATFAGYYHDGKPAEEEEVEPYVVGDGTFSNSDSGDAAAYKTPVRGRRGRWQEYEEEGFPRGESADGYLSKKAKRAKKYKERAEDGDALFGERDRESPWTPQESGGEYSRKRHGVHRHAGDRKSQKSSNGNAAEGSGLEEGEVRVSWRARKRDELEKWKAEKVEREPRKSRSNGEGSAEGAKSGVRGNGQNEHTHWDDDEDKDGGVGSRSSRKYSRFKEEKVKRKRNSSREGSRGEAEEPVTRRIVVTKPAHKKIKYM